VLVCVTLLVGMVVAFQFVSASDYKQVARSLRSAQAEALVDVASDEIFTSVADHLYGKGQDPAPWVQSILESLDRTRVPGPRIDRIEDVDFPVARMPVTRSVLDSPETLVTFSSIQGRVGPFSVLNQVIPGEGYYREDAYGDGQVDLLPWDLRAPLGVTFNVKGRESLFRFDYGQTYHRGQEFQVTDTTPLASAFTLFSFHPSPDEAYAMNDMRGGGDMDVYPALDGPGRRLMVRGPLLFVPDEAPTQSGRPAHLAGEAPQSESRGYPDNQYAGSPGSLATIPGPRLVAHPAGGPGGGLIGGAGDVLDSLVTDLNARRSREEKSASVLKTKSKTYTFRIKVKPYVPFPLNLLAPMWMTRSFTMPELTYDLGEVAVSLTRGLRGASPVFNTIDKDPVSYFPASAYFISSGGQGTQTFRVHHTMPSYSYLAQALEGVHVPFGQAAGEPWVRQAVNEGDRIQLEPIPRADRKPGASAGLFGLYGIVRHIEKTYSVMPVREFLYWLIKTLMKKKLSGLILRVALANLDDAEVDLIGQALRQANLTEDLEVMVHRFTEDPPPSIGGVSSFSTLESALRAHDAAVLPFGSYHHSDGFWSSPVGQSRRQDLLNDLVNEKSGHGGGRGGHAQTLDDLLKERGNPNYSRVDPTYPRGSFAEEMARWLCEDMAGKLLTGFGTQDPITRVKGLFTALSGIVGMPALPVVEQKRPKGAFGPMGLPPASVLNAQAVSDGFKGSYYPPKFRDFAQIATRVYPDFDSYVGTESGPDGVLNLRGVVYIEKMVARGFAYRGRGIIICKSRAGQGAVITGPVGPADDAMDSMLILVHRVAPGEMTGTTGSLRLASPFHGSVYSDNGLQMDGVLHGNLVTGLMNKSRTGDMSLVWDPKIHMPDPGAGMVPYWTVELGGEVTSLSPE